MADRPNFFRCDDSIVCAECRRKTLAAWSPEAVRAKGGTEDEMVRASDFLNLGRTPWAGNPPGDRYIQCDECLGQWGPDA